MNFKQIIFSCFKGRGLFYILYALLMLLLFPVSGTNPRSRLALQASMCESIPHGNLDYTINVQQKSSYTIPWTIDWAKTPSGDYYSNKAPGPSYLALPFHCALYWATSFGFYIAELRVAQHFRWLYFAEILCCFFLQVLPLILFSDYFLKKNNSEKHSTRESYFLIALFFGSTASIYMNSWFGHGLSALLFLGSIMAYLERKWLLWGLALGFLVLSDYGTVYLLPPVLLLVMFEKGVGMTEKTQCAFKTALGALPAFLLWAHYHIKSFGGLLSLPQHYQNPEFLDHPSQAGSISAVMNFFPKPQIIAELLFGFKRGLLVTQPWILGVILFSVLLWKFLDTRYKRAFYYSVFSLAALLLMNASFGQWHAGSAAGPRYLSAVFLAFSVLLFYLFPLLKRTQKLLLGLGLVLSLLLYVFALSVSVIPPPDALWPTLFSIAATKKPTFFLRLSIFSVLFVLAFWPWIGQRVSRAKHAEH